MAGWQFRAQDTASSTAAELSTVSNTVNNALKILDSGWMCHVEAIRSPSTAYPHAGASFFPDRVTGLIEKNAATYFRLLDFSTPQKPFWSSATSRSSFRKN